MAFCQKCGKELAPDAKFCDGCGNEINAVPAAPVAAPQAAPATPVQNPVAELQTAPAAPTPKKKKPVKLVVALILVVAVLASVINYFTGDGYTYNKAVKLIEAGEYEEAYEIFDGLGDYKDSANYLPFNGTYVNLSVGDERTIVFSNGAYTKTIPSSDGDSVYEGTFETTSYTSAVLTQDNGTVEKFGVYSNYIYTIDDEEFIFDETVDISDGKLDGPLTEITSFDMTIGGVKSKYYLTWEYEFDEDGTYTYKGKSYTSSTAPKAFTEKSGTYRIENNLIIMDCNEDGNTICYLVIDGTVYRSVYERNYF